MRHLGLLSVCCCLGTVLISCEKSVDPAVLEKDFRGFLATYTERIEQRDLEFLGTVHPGLPKPMQGFFLDLTLNMMKHAGEGGLEPEVDCKESNICTVTWPQPGDSWLAQKFIKEVEDGGDHQTDRSSTATSTGAAAEGE